jgi:hypothetical protein
MQGLLDRILTVNLVASTVVFYAAARLYVLPNLRGWSFHAVMPPILLLHSFRQLGLMFLAPGVPRACLRSLPIRRRSATCLRRSSPSRRSSP